jgi:GH25 family lysozyme M1 (1,4-beta-N-acetylmuramidase)
MVYTYPSFVEVLERYAGQAGEQAIASLANRPLWIAHYTQSYERPPTIPEPWVKAVMWQASGGSKESKNYCVLPGTQIDVDVDLVYGTVEDLPACSTSGLTK